MTLLKASNKEELRLVGVHLPSSVYDYLTLYTLSKGITKSALLRQLLDPWIEAEKTDESVLLEQIVQRIQSGWRKKKKLHPKTSFNQFITEIKKELLGKGLTRVQVKSILSNFE
jgi:hypothetical protein